MTSTAAPGSTPPPRLAAKAGLAVCGERPYSTSTEGCCAVRSLNQYPCVARRRVPSPLLCFAPCGTVGIQYRVAERSWGCGAATRCEEPRDLVWLRVDRKTEDSSAPKLRACQG
jgi:hypothetical protein